MRFIPTLEQVQDAAHLLPPADRYDRPHGTLVRVPLLSPFRPYDRMSHPAEALFPIIDFRLERYVDPYGRVWFRWAHIGDMLI